MVNTLLKLPLVGFFSIFIHLSFSQEKTIVLDGKNTWRLQKSENINVSQGFRNYPDIKISHSIPENKNKYDLILTIKNNSLKDLANHYSIDSSSPYFISQDKSFHKTSSLLFIGSKNPVVLIPKSNSLFETNSNWKDFTIEFWLYPNKNHNSEILMNWKGLIKKGNEWKDQNFKVSFDKGSLLWTMKNLFVSTESKDIIVKISGNEPLKPQVWMHHLLRFDSQTGLIEYLINGKPVSIKYAPRQESVKNSPPFPIIIGEISENKLILGENFTGLLESVSISRYRQSEKALYLKPPQQGSFVTEVIDLESPESQLLKIEALQNLPRYSEIDYAYKISNEVVFTKDDQENTSLKQVKGEWIPFRINTPIESTYGKYLQIKATLFPTKQEPYTPTLSQISIKYFSNKPLNPPVITKTEAYDQAIFLEWLPVANSHVKGYKVYFGLNPHIYLGDETVASPIDVGNETSFTLKGLKNGLLYYISIVAYGEDPIRSMGPFSSKVVARPLPSLKKFPSQEKP